MAHVLIASDDPLLSRLVRFVAEMDGHDVSQVDTGDAAIAVLRAALHPLVVVMELYATGPLDMIGPRTLATALAERDTWERHRWLAIGLQAPDAVREAAEALGVRLIRPGGTTDDIAAAIDAAHAELSAGEVSRGTRACVCQRPG